MSELDRTYYYRKKHTFLLFHTMLIIFRFLGIVLFGCILIFVILYSFFSNGKEQWNNAFVEISKIVRIVVPIVVGLWITLKVIVVILKKKLLEIKRKAGVLDEI